MATSTGQRVGIWVIAVAMVVGTLAGFLALILTPQNDANDQKRTEAALATYQENQAAYEKKQQDQQAEVDKRAAELSKKYASSFVPQQSKVAKFDPKSATAVKVDVIKEGTGATIESDTTYLAYYIGFDPSGNIFDSSLAQDKKSLKAPLIVRQNGVIQGWSEAMNGKKIGGIYKLTIPSDKAYGEQGSGDIKPNTPLTFIVMPVETLTAIPEPEIPAALLEAYGQ